MSIARGKKQAELREQQRYQNWILTKLEVMEEIREEQQKTMRRIGLVVLAIVLLLCFVSVLLMIGEEGRASQSENTDKHATITHTREAGLGLILERQS